MVIIERSYKQKKIKTGICEHIDRKVFSDNDISGAQAFLDERSNELGRPWIDLDFKYIKL
jgi:hypothetical protein